MKRFLQPNTSIYRIYGTTRNFNSEEFQAIEAPNIYDLSKRG